MITNEQFSSKYIQLLKENIPNIKSSIYTAVFSKNKIKETTDAVIFGFYIGFFSSCLEINVNEDGIKKMLDIYNAQANGTDSLDMLLEQVSIAYSKYFSLFTNRKLNKDDVDGIQIENRDKENIENINDTIVNKNNIIDINERHKHTEINKHLNDEDNEKKQLLHNNSININKYKEDNNNNNNNYNEDNNNNNNNNNYDENSNHNNNNNDLNIKDLFEYEEAVETTTKKCLICLEEFSIVDELNFWLDCNCIIHSTCFDQYIASCVKDNSLPIKCPECNKEINSSFVYESLTQSNQSLISKYEKFTLDLYAINNHTDVNCCPTAGCSYMFFYQEGDARFVCPTCENDYCLSCKTNWHEDISCEENKKLTNTNYLDEKFDTFVRGAQYKQCPFCSTWVEKIDGCDYMTCRCGKAFCYLCGEKNPKSHYCFPLVANRRGNIQNRKRGRRRK